MELSAPAVAVYVFHFTGGPSQPCLLEAAQRHCAGRTLGPDAFAVARTDRGKPYFPHLPEVQFSLSHSGDYLLCAVGPEPLGLDIQVHQPCNREQIARRCFHPEEAALLAGRGERDFFDLWAAKESYVKFTGQGLEGFSDFSAVSPSGLRDRVGGAALRLIPFQPGYSLCLCGRELGSVALLSCDQSGADGTACRKSGKATFSRG